MGGNVLRKEQRAALPPYGTQLLNAGCRVTSIQKFLGHKELRTTMIYAHAHDQTVAEDYFAAMERVERRLEIAPEDNIVKVPEEHHLLILAEKLSQHNLGFDECLNLVRELQDAIKVFR